MFLANPFLLPSNSNFRSSENSKLLPYRAASRLSKRLMAYHNRFCPQSFIDTLPRVKSYMSPIPPGNNHGYEFSNIFFVISYSIFDSRVSSNHGKFSNYEKYAETYHIGESWSMGRKFIIWDTWPVVLAMSLKECIMFALFPPGRGSGWFACIVVMSISAQS